MGGNAIETAPARSVAPQRTAAAFHPAAPRHNGHRPTKVQLRAVLRVPAFTVVWAAELQSIAGDQLARVALAVLVFTRTGSAVATAGAYAATFVPAVVGGSLISRIGDHLPRRVVMIGVDGLRALLFAIMAVPAVPLSAVVALVVVAVAVGPVFTAAEVSDLSARLPAELFRLGTAMRLMSNQAAQVLGFGVGGVVVAAIGSRPALLVDAATYVVSMLAVSVLALRSRSAGTAVAPPRAVPVANGASSAPFDGLWRTARVRRLLLLCCLVGLFIAPEGVAVPFAASVGAPTWASGVLLGAAAFGSAIGAGVVAKFVPPDARERIALGMAVLAGLPLVLTAVLRWWPAVAIVWFASGFLVAYMVEVNSALVQAIPEEQRARYVGVAGALLLGAQGAGLLLIGSLAAVTSAGGAVAIAGMSGSLLAATVVGSERRGSSRGRRRN